MGQAAHTGDMRSIHKSLVGQPEEKGPHDRLGRIRNCNTKLNKQSRTADEGWPSSLGVGRGANNPSL
jgi:hypothetical protein